MSYFCAKGSDVKFWQMQRRNVTSQYCSPQQPLTLAPFEWSLEELRARIDRIFGTKFICIFLCRNTASEALFGTACVHYRETATPRPPAVHLLSSAASDYRMSMPWREKEVYRVIKRLWSAIATSRARQLL